MQVGIHGYSCIIFNLLIYLLKVPMWWYLNYNGIKLKKKYLVFAHSQNFQLNYL